MDPVAQMQLEYDRALEQLKDGRKGLEQYRGIVEKYAILSGSEEVNKEHLRYVLSKFVPPVDTDEKRLQNLAAVLECIDINFLPQEFKKK